MAREATRGSVVQKRAPRTDGWTKARRGAFLAHLADSCNVTAACRALGVATASAYQRRARDPEFERQWDWALAQGYVRLETELLQRALGDAPIAEAIDALGDHGGDHGDDHGDDHGGGRGEPARPFDPELALKLLARQADGTKRRNIRLAAPTTHEILDALDRKLTAMEKRLRRQA